MKDSIRQSVVHWKLKAEADRKTVQILLDSTDGPKDIICFHCQQYIEKLIKAVLTAHQLEFPKTHDLRRLLQILEYREPSISEFIEQIDDLTVHGIQTRYPDYGMPITDEQVKQTIALTETVGGHLAAMLYKMDI
jgi:HEPN domain-containing protein